MVLTFYTFDLVRRMIRNLEQSSKAADRIDRIDSKAADWIDLKAIDS